MKPDFTVHYYNSVSNNWSTPMTDDLKYLDEYTLAPDEAVGDITTDATFNPIEGFGHPNGVEIEPGIYTEKSKFSAKGFPRQNLDEFLFIPLYLNGKARVMYWETYSGGTQPPDCSSNDGVYPLKPLSLQHGVITECRYCPLYGFSKEYKCRGKANMIGFAYFPEENELLVPVRKTIPGLSLENFNDMTQQLNDPVLLGGTPKRIPMHTRLVRVSAIMKQNKAYGVMATWGFEVLKDQFVPPHLIKGLEIFKPAASSFFGPPSVTPAQLTGSPDPSRSLSGSSAVAAPENRMVAAALGGGTPALPAASISVMDAEAEAEY